MDKKLWEKVAMLSSLVSSGNHDELREKSKREGLEDETGTCEAIEKVEESTVY